MINIPDFTSDDPEIPTTRTELMLLCDKGAWTFDFVDQILSRKADGYRQAILKRLSNLDIIGEDLYVLWNDLCDRDLSKMSTLCQRCPIEILKEASSIKTGGKGIEMVQKYFV